MLSYKAVQVHHFSLSIDQSLMNRSLLDSEADAAD